MQSTSIVDPYEKELVQSVDEIITGFKAAHTHSIEDLLTQFRSADASQGYQPFDALCNQIIPFVINRVFHGVSNSNWLENSFAYTYFSVLTRSNELEALKTYIEYLTTNKEIAEIGKHTLKEEILLGFAYQFGLGVRAHLGEATRIYLTVTEKTDSISCEEKKNASKSDSIMRGIALTQLAEIGLRNNTYFLEVAKKITREAAKQLCVEYLNEAIQLGNSRASMELGAYHCWLLDKKNNAGRDILANETKTEIAYDLTDIEKVAANGCSQAYYFLFRIAKEKSSVALAHARKAVGLGSVPALFRLGEIYLREVETLFSRRANKHDENTRAQLIKNCREILNLASEYGSSQATLGLNRLEKLSEGSGHKPSDLQMARLYHKAFEQRYNILTGPHGACKRLDDIPVYAQGGVDLYPSLRCAELDSSSKERLENEFMKDEELITLSNEQIKQEDEYRNKRVMDILARAHKNFSATLTPSFFTNELSREKQQKESFEICYRVALVVAFDIEPRRSKAQKILLDLATKKPEIFAKFLVREPMWRNYLTLLLGKTAQATEFFAKGLTLERALDVSIIRKIAEVTSLPIELLGGIVGEYLSIQMKR